MLALVGGGLVLVGGLTVLLVARQPNGNHPSVAVASPSGAPSVTLQAAAAPGQDPYTGSVAASTPTSTTATATASASTPVNGGGTVDGAAVGLYGGSLHNTSCNVDQLSSFLTTHADKGKAWAGVEGIDPATIPDYLKSLTSALLRVDTRVTNHGFANGAATSFQSVLQAGSAVLVDSHGVPRVRCACGNPLTPPLADAAQPAYAGAAWPGFQPQKVVTVRPADAPTAELVMVDQDSGTYFTRPVGSGGGTDQATTPAATGSGGSHSASASSGASSSSSAGGSAPASSPSSGKSPSAGASSGGASSASHAASSSASHASVSSPAAPLSP
ncbi:DUF6777 domain-containing protein [Streptomyces tateyamensis]|uniref:DUF6777 domain-containing protein n=1 Tax=Streptomyces tateyamensis TaxID=565073 RepID=UPI0011B7303E|nr:DUF6777 domain-containing protein [Streptomyces tateyamensis]